MESLNMLSTGSNIKDSAVTELPQHQDFFKPLTKFQDPFAEENWTNTYKDHGDTTVNNSFLRIATSIASVEDTPEKRQEWTEKFYDLLTNFKGVPGGRTFSNAGTQWAGTTLMNCFVGPRGKYDIDSIEGIYNHLLAQSQTLKSEGGWGENFSYIRPRGSFIHGIGVETPGAVKYMELFDKASEIITSGSGKKSTNAKAKGKIRKGAMMGVLDIWHPDIIEFVTAKQQPGRLTKFNVSVNVCDDFMKRVNEIKQLEQVKTEVLKDAPTPDSFNQRLEELDKWDLIFPETTHPKYRKEWNGDIHHWVSKGFPVKVFNTVSVKWLWNLIMESTYNRAEPGVLFLDRANYFNPFYYGETIFATNPCGEQTLSPGNICCLGSINVTQFVHGDSFDYDAIEKYTRYMVRFLDNVNSYSSAPLPEYEDSMKKKRRIGLGVMGWGSALFMMKIRFGSKRAAEIREKMMSTIARTAYKASIDLAEEKGMFTYCNPEKHAAGVFIQQLGLSQEYLDKLLRVGIRNASLMSQQPTGNTSIVANIVSGGIEPIFMPEYVRTVILARTPDEILERTPKWWEGAWHETDLFKFTFEGDEQILRAEHFGQVYKIDKNRGLTKEVLCEDYGVRYLKKNGEWDPSADWAVTTTNLTVDDHVSDLEGFARWTDSACSKTCNIPHDYPFEQFKDLYLDVYNTGFIKGFTSYRAGTMTSVLAAVDEKTATNEDEEIVLDDVKLPDSLPATMKTLRAESKKWYLTVTWNDTMTRPFALFVHTNHHEKNVIALDAVDRLTNLAERKGIPQQFIDEVTFKISGSDNSSKIARMISLNLRHGVLIKNIVAELDKIEEAYVGSFLFTIKKFLGSFIKDGEKVEGEKCQECHGSNVVFQEGCKICKDCGSSKCG
jgi:ribonucleoside-diphosphate reductase alpha chain